MTFSPHHLPSRPDSEDANPASADAVTVFLEPLRGTASFVNYSSAARHFLHWLDLRRIRLASVDATTVARFAKHRCRCPRYSPAQLRDPVYLGRVGRFVRFLEDRGDIPVTDGIEDVRLYLSLYADCLTSLGFSPGAWRIHYSGAEHFTAWLRISRLQWSDADDAIIERFVRHLCRCSLCRKGPGCRRRARTSVGVGRIGSSRSCASRVRSRCPSWHHPTISICRRILHGSGSIADRPSRRSPGTSRRHRGGCPCSATIPPPMTRSRSATSS